MFKASIRTAIGAIAGRYVSMFLTLVSFILLGKFFGNEDLGIYSSSFGIASSFCYWISLGGAEAILRNSSGENTDRKWWISNCFFTHSISLFVATTVCLLSLLLNFFDYLDTVKLYVILWTAGWGLLISISHILIAFKRESYGNFMFYGVPATISFVVVCFSLGSGSVLDVIMVISIMYFLFSFSLSIILINYLWRVGVDLERVLVSKLYVNGFLYSTSRVIQSVILWSPIWLASLLHSLEAAGVLAIVFRLGLGVNAFMSAVRMILRRVTLVTFDSSELLREQLFKKLSCIGTISASICLLTIFPVYQYGDWLFGFFFDIYDEQAKYLLTIVIVALAVESLLSLQEDLMKNVLELKGIVLAQAFSLFIYMFVSYALFYIAGVYAFVLAFVLQVLLYQFYISYQSFKKYGLFVRPTFRVN